MAGRDTRAELIARPLLELDVSPVVGQKAYVLEEFTPVFSVAVHLPLGGSGH
jgi:hypothetical protein